MIHVKIIGAPRTKKTHNQGTILPASAGKGQPCPKCRTPLRFQVFPSKQWRAWVKVAAIEVDGARLAKANQVLLLIPPDGGVARPWVPIAEPVNCRALFFLDADRGDAVGYYQGLADLLEERGVLVNDRLITQWDGCRLMPTAGRPRVEIELTPI